MCSSDLYKLVENNWKVSSFEQYSLEGSTSSTGRIALQFDKLSDGYQTGIQSNKISGTTNFIPEEEVDTTDMGIYTSTLSERTNFVAEEEIPLAIQIITSKDGVSSYNVEQFQHPDIYAKHNYEHIYAITVRFHEKV